MPDLEDDLPKDAPSIRRRIGEIVFNSSLVAEMQAISAMRSVADRGAGPASALDVRNRPLLIPSSVMASSAGDRLPMC